MALPARRRTFAFENCHDMLEKLAWEIEHLRALETGDIHEVALAAYWATNAACTAWHLSDWVYADMNDHHRAEIPLVEGKREGLENFQANLLQRADLRVCAAIALTVKHALLREGSAKRFDGIEAEISEMPAIVLADGRIIGKGWHLIVKMGEDAIPVRQFLDNAFEFWTGFTYRHGIAPFAPPRPSA